MGNCLVTKLKAVVNNPNLPVLDTMQQFTLDAIAASGNASMTDDQKWALNRFFYQIGAIDNSTLWQKIQGVYLPVICGDNVATAMTDYVNNTVIAAPSDSSFSNHGLIGDTAEGRNYNGSNLNMSFIGVYTKDDLPNQSGNIFGVRNTAKGGICGYSSLQAGGFGISAQVVSARFGNETAGATGAIVLTRTTDVLFGVNVSGVYTKQVLERTFTEETLTEKMVCWGYSYSPIAVYVAGAGMTEDEAKTVMDAAIALKNAFTEQ